MSRMKLLAVTALLTLASAIDVPSDHVVLEKRSSTTGAWIKGARLHPHSILPMRIALKQPIDDDEAARLLMDVSHPTSPNYGKHWSAEQVIEHFQPSDDTVEAVAQWLHDSGIDKTRLTHSDNKVWFAFDATAAEAEALLKTQYHEYEDSATGVILPACDSYHVPHAIEEHLDFVSPGVQLLKPRGRSAGRHRKRNLRPGQSAHGFVPPAIRKADGSLLQEAIHDLKNCDTVITPICIQALYYVPSTSHRLKPSPKNVLGIYESDAQYWYGPDLDKFFTNFTIYPAIPNGTRPGLFSVDGGVGETTNQTVAGGEVMLDLELAYPLIYPQSISIFSEDDPYYQSHETFDGGFNNFLDSIDGSYCTYRAFGEQGNRPGYDPSYPDPNPGGYKGQLECGVYKPTNVISVSYAGKEALLSANYQKRQCNEFLKLGLQGVSILFASGDSGVGDYPAPYGQGGGEDGATGCLGPKGLIFNPEWPATCPYLTTVGATKVYAGNSVFGKEPESAVFDPAGHPYAVNYSSGGGFSNIYPVPSYQASAVATYFQNYSPPYPYYSALAKNVDQIVGFGAKGGVYNRIGRGFPDVAAVGDNIAVVVAGEFGLSGGTSAATPIFASILNRINEDRIRIGKGPIGFVNPVLYQHPEVFRDITNGTNPGCLTKGFSAVPGWDPLTGLGTPNYVKMLKLFLQLP